MPWWVGSLIMGLIAGGVAGRIVEGRGFGCLGNIVVGIIGGLVGGWLFSLLNVRVGMGFVGSLVTATVGACVFLLVLNLFRRKRE